MIETHSDSRSSPSHVSASEQRQLGDPGPFSDVCTPRWARHRDGKRRHRISFNFAGRGWDLRDLRARLHQQPGNFHVPTARCMQQRRDALLVRAVPWSPKSKIREELRNPRSRLGGGVNPAASNTFRWLLASSTLNPNPKLSPKI